MSRRVSGSARKKKQRAKVQYTIRREDRQLSGVEETTPQGAINQERVPPGPNPPAPELVTLAIRRGWNVSEEGKARAVNDLVSAIQDPETKPLMRVRCFQALLLADKVQRERDDSEIG